MVLLLLAAFKHTHESALLKYFLKSSLAQQSDKNDLQQDDVAVSYLIHQYLPESSETKEQPSNDYSEISNRLIKTQCILSIPGMPPEKIRQLEDLVKTPLKFASTVSFGIIQVINYKFMKAFYDHIDVSADTTIAEKTLSIHLTNNLHRQTIPLLAKKAQRR